MILPILRYGAQELKTPSKPVDVFNGELEKIARNMVETMYAAPGIGLAAAQVGINIRLATIDLSVGEEAEQLIILCNPEIISRAGEQKSEEGCLSIPEFTETIVRPERMVIRGQSLRGEEMNLAADGLLARCISHEIDHMNGVFFIDHLSSLKRTLIRNRIRRLARAGDW